MSKLISFLNYINKGVGKIVSWFSLALVILICLDVAMRYLFDFTLIWVIELEIYFFSLLFLLSAGYAFQKDKHVRVDVFYTDWSEKRRAWVDLLGTIFLLLPWCLVVIWVSYNYAFMSLLIQEKSAQPGGLPALYILKFSITLAFVLLLFQAVSTILQSIKVIQKG